MNAAMKILILGGSGFLSGTLARLAVERGHQVWALNRGKRQAVVGVTGLTADRKVDADFRAALGEAGVHWDLVVDCIAFEAADAEQDAAVLPPLADHLVMISTDFVYQPAQRRFPQGEEGEFISEGYGGKKRQAEQVLQSAGTGSMLWTVLRPCHIYGPGSQLGCLPAHGRDPRLLERLRAGETLRLVGGGYFLQQPILARDLAETVLSLPGLPAAASQIFCAAGPDIVDSREYYRIIAAQLGVELRVEELPVAAYRVEHPEAEPFLCHRIYDLSKLRAAGAAVPSTPLVDGLREHVLSFLA
jgi:nucleoside-diphosphate-sugar epimerase